MDETDDPHRKYRRSFYQYSMMRAITIGVLVLAGICILVPALVTGFVFEVATETIFLIAMVSSIVLTSVVVPMSIITIVLYRRYQAKVRDGSIYQDPIIDLKDIPDTSNL